MRKTIDFLCFLYRHHVIRYIFVGGTTFLIDLGVLVFGHEVLGLKIAIATTLSYWVSVIYNFSLNRWWTFSASETKKLHEHALLYGCLLAFNYGFTVIFVSTMSHVIYYGLAKVLATGIQIIWTYPLYKYAIFNTDSKRPVAESSL